MAARIKAIQARHGADSVAFLSTGQIATEEMALLGAVAKFGMGLVAIRDDEDKAASVGVNTPIYKALAYIASAVWIGAAGGVYAYYLSFIDPRNQFDIVYSVFVVLAVLLGHGRRINALLDRARTRFKELGIRNVHLRHGDGFQGWPAHGPYDGILMAAAPLAIPEVLFQQLAPGGRLIAPVGPEGRQQLLRMTRRGDELHKELLGQVSFVPLLKGTT